MTDETTPHTPRVAHIFTGPPGAGKLIHVYNDPELRTLPIFCCYHFNKSAWDYEPHDALVLCAYAPKRQDKAHWIYQARKAGYEPKLYLVDTPRVESTPRMEMRPKNNLLYKEIAHWYKNYRPHEDEIIVRVPWDPDMNRVVYR